MKLYRIFRILFKSLEFICHFYHCRSVIHSETFVWFSVTDCFPLSNLVYPGEEQEARTMKNLFHALYEQGIIPKPIGPMSRNDIRKAKKDNAPFGRTRERSIIISMII